MFTIITGAQFGDEGKGKIVDMMASQYDIVARFQGGDNAGHTVVAEGKHTNCILSLRRPFRCAPPYRAGNGDESRDIDGRNCHAFRKWGEVPPSKLGIDAKTSIIMPYHVALDGLRESKRAVKIGTTNRVSGLPISIKWGAMRYRWRILLTGSVSCVA